jgi:hypothetical protein
MSGWAFAVTVTIGACAAVVALCVWEMCRAAANGDAPEDDFALWEVEQELELGERMERINEIIRYRRLNEPPR